MRFLLRPATKLPAFLFGTTNRSLFAFILVRYNHMDLQQLLKECRRQSITAQRYLYDQYATGMFLVCRRYVKTDEIAEEMVMNGFLKFFSSLNKFEFVNEAATIGWIKKIMVNECLMHLRRHNSFLQVATEDIPEIEMNEEIISNISTEEIFVLITQLPVGYRTIFNLFVIENMTHKEIAAALGIHEGTSKSQLSKARQMLQQMLIKNNSDYAHRRTK